MAKTSSWRWLLLLGGATLVFCLVLTLIGAIRSHMERGEQRQLALEAKALSDQFERNKDQILDTIRKQIEDGDFDEAEAAITKYRASRSGGRSRDLRDLIGVLDNRRYDARKETQKRGEAVETVRDSTSDSVADSRPWYKGGTLHSSKVPAWRAASYRNRLATSADYLTQAKKYTSLPSDFKSKAATLEACITEAIGDAELVSHKSVSEFGAVCLVLLEQRGEI